MSNDVQPGVADSPGDGSEESPEVDGEIDTASSDDTATAADDTADDADATGDTATAADDTADATGDTADDADAAGETADATGDTADDADAAGETADAADDTDDDADATGDTVDDADATGETADAADDTVDDADATGETADAADDTADDADATGDTATAADDTADDADATGDTADATGDTATAADDTADDADATGDTADATGDTADATGDTADEADDTADDADATGDTADEADDTADDADATGDTATAADDTADDADATGETATAADGTADDADATGDTATAADDTGAVEIVSAVIDTEDGASSDADEEAPSTDDTPSTEELAAELALLRADYEALERQLDAAAKPAPERKHLHRPSRYWVSIACVVLGGLLLPLAVLVRWTSNTVLDTDSYVETVAPLAQDEDIQEALSFRISVIVLEAIDFRELAKDALPTQAGFLAAPIESGVRMLVADVVQELVSTEAFEELWEDVNRVGHENVVAILTGEGNDTLDTADGKVVVHLGPITKEVLNRLDEILGTNLENAIPEERLDGDFVLVESDDLANLQDEISLFDRLSWLIPILTIALLAASVIISRPRRLAFGRLGLAIAVPMAISVLLYDWIRGQYIGALPDDTHNPDAAAAFFDITTRFVPRDMLVLLVLGVVILFLTWLFGPTGWAGRARAWWGAAVGTAGDASEGRDVGPAPRWVADNERTLLAFAVALGVVTLLVWTRPTGLVVLIIVIVVALLMAATSLLAEVGRRAESADEQRADAADRESSDPRQPSETGSDAAAAKNAPT